MLSGQREFPGAPPPFQVMSLARYYVGCHVIISDFCP